MGEIIKQGEVCANCDRVIGKLETPYLFENQIVCAGCASQLSAVPPAQDFADGDVPADDFVYDPAPLEPVYEPPAQQQIIIQNIVAVQNNPVYTPGAKQRRQVPKKAKKGFGCLSFFALLIVAFVVFAIINAAMHPEEIKKQIEANDAKRQADQRNADAQARDQAAKDVAAEADRQRVLAGFKQIVASSPGAIFSADYKAHLLRVTPEFWDSMKIDKKTSVMKAFYTSCWAASFEGEVTVMSDANDDEFGKYSDLWGATIKR